jgi:hypothetical protein
MTKLQKAITRQVQADNMPRLYRNDLIVTLYPNAIVGVREVRGRNEVLLDLGRLYVKTLIEQALQTPPRKRGKAR